MKAACLCNGPSRVAYAPNNDYRFVIGCNIPWTRVDATVVLDSEVVDVWAKQPDVITCPTYFSVDAWRRTDAIKKRHLFLPLFADLVKKSSTPYQSSGHIAVAILINKGYNTIDVYGCDSWFSYDVSSYTRSFVQANLISNPLKHIEGWRARWIDICNSHPDVTLNFIDHDQNIHPAQLPKTQTN